MADIINLLVVGECGDGKSTLIDNLRDPNKSEQPICGKNVRGVTKEILMYPCPDLNGMTMNLIDTPGVGDHDVTVIALVSMIEAFLTEGMVPGGIRGVVVTQPVPDGRIKLGAQIVQAVVDKGFVAPAGDDKYANIILCGTKVDKADEDDKINFMHGLAGSPSVRSVFFDNSPNKTGPCALVHKDDYSQLLQAIRQLPATNIAFEKPESKVMAEVLASKLGMQPEAFESQMNIMREVVEEQSQQMRQLLQQMHEDQQRHREDTERKDRMIQEMIAKMEQDRARAEQVRVERDRQLELKEQEQNEEHRREREQAAKALEQMMQQLQQEQEKTRKHQAQLQKEKEEENKRHQEMMLRMQRESRDAIQAAQKSSKSCFPGDATVIKALPCGPHAVAMCDLKVGDQVLAVGKDGSLFFDDVYFFGHANTTEVAKYVSLQTSQTTLQLSGKHFVACSESPCIWTEKKYLYAEEVECGHHLWVTKDGKLQQEEVIATTSLVKKGVFNPYTLSGNIVVDGVVASAHSDWLLDDLCPEKYVGFLPAIYQAILLPGRLLYRLLGATAADALDVNNPQINFKAEIGTSPMALAFLVVAAAMPAALGGALLHQSLS